MEYSNPFPEPETKSSPTRCSLDDLHLTFHRWFGAEYDLDAIDAVLAALREIYDGRWERNVGIDGGQTLTWTGRIIVIGAVTTAWDSARSVVSSMGDRSLPL